MSKESKILLKEAREAIKNKDYKTSLKICKQILRNDKDNYMGLVLLGVTFQEGGPKDQAPFAFRKATLLSPTQPLAWQGLANYYEKENNENKKDLIEIYSQLIVIENDSKKYSELCEKLITTCVQYQDEAEKVVDFLYNETKKENCSNDKINIIWEHLASLFIQLTNIPPNLNSIYEDALSAVVKNQSTVTIDYYKRYLKLLYKNKKYDRLITEAIAMHSTFSSEIYPLEWICKLYSEIMIENIEFNIQIDIDIYINKLLQINNQSTMALLAKSVILFNETKYIECRELLNTIISLRPTMHAWILLAKCNYKLHCYVEVEQAAEQSIKLLINSTNSNDYLLNLIEILLCDALSKQDDVKKLEEAVKRCKKFLEQNDNFTVLTACACALTTLKNYTEAEKYMNLARKINENHPDLYVIEATKFQMEGQIDEALKILNSYNKRDSAEIFLKIGNIYWEKQQFKDSLMAYLEAAKIDPNRYACFIYLAQYYEQINDLDKARRCYQKAFKINPKCAEAGIGLSNIYRVQKNWLANQQLLESITINGLDSRCKWAWLQLAFHYLDQGNHKGAIDSLRSVIRSDPLDSHAWESLADAYLVRGAYTAAMKSYQRASDLSPDTLYPKLQIASIKYLLGEYTDARDDYEMILKTNTNYVPALKGLAETYLSLAKLKFQQQLIGCARDNVQAGIDKITQALQERKDLSCLWKILADCCNFAAKLPDKHCFIYVLALLAVADTVNGLTLLHRQELFNLATRSYCRALSLADSNILIWHDISANYYSQSKYISDKNSRRKLQERALAASKHCVTNNQHLWQHWNLLGVIAVQLKYLKLAQHAFIKAIALYKNNAVSWTNLGTLYLMLGDIKLANEAFSNAQTTDPGYVQCWIGQALIAESLGHEDAMDLFRHSAQLGSDHIQGGLGYAHWVCSVLVSVGPRANELYNIKNMHAIPMATDSLDWYTEKIATNACAWNMLGLLKERQQLFQSSANALENSLKVVDASHRDIVLTNLGRVLIKAGQHTKAIEYYKQISEASFISGCGLALAYFKAEMWEESYQTYETALEWLAPDDSNKSHVLVAMSTMAYMFHGAEDAKTLLFQCIQLEPPSVAGLLAACALGLLHGDMKMAQLVLKELMEFNDNRDYLKDVADLKAFNYLLQDKIIYAKSSLSHDLHRHPNEAHLWLSLSRLLLRINRTVKAASVCALAAIQHGRTILDVSKILCLVSLAELLMDNFKNALKLAQKAVHSYPTAAEGWMLLISSFLPICEQSKNFKNTEWLRLVINYVRRQTNATRPMTQWLSNYERKVTIMAKEYEN